MLHGVIVLNGFAHWHPILETFLSPVART